MASVQDDTLPVGRPATAVETRDRHGGLLAGAGVLGALLASSCCIVPIVLVVLGISGAWVSTLTALAPYKPYIVAVTAGLLGLGYWQIYFRPKRACVDGSSCTRAAAGRITKVALWLATVLVLLAATVNSWAPLFY